MTKRAHLLFYVILWQQFAVKAPQRGPIKMEGVAGNCSERDSLIRNGLWKVIFSPLSDRTFPSLRPGRSPMLANARRPCEWSIWATSCLFFLFFNQKVVICCGVLECKSLHAHRHTPPESQLRPGGSALQTVLCCFATRRLHWSRWEMSVGGKREHYSLIRFFFFFLPSPSAHIFPHSRSCYMNHSLTSTN